MTDVLGRDRRDCCSTARSLAGPTTVVWDSTAEAAGVYLVVVETEGAGRRGRSPWSGSPVDGRPRSTLGARLAVLAAVAWATGCGPDDAPRRARRRHGRRRDDRGGGLRAELRVGLPAPQERRRPTPGLPRPHDRRGPARAGGLPPRPRHDGCRPRPARRPAGRAAGRAGVRARGQPPRLGQRRRESSGRSRRRPSGSASATSRRRRWTRPGRSARPSRRRGSTPRSPASWRRAPTSRRARRTS